ncbi:MAG: DUF1217 domain-containing protein [Jannaschia sp.]
MTYSPIVLGTGVSGYAFVNRTRATQQALYSRSPAVERQTQSFLTDIRDVKTSDQLLDNRAMLTVILGAFGLDDDINNRAFIKKVLDSDLSDPRSLANRLADKRYLALAETFNFAGEGGPLAPDGRSGGEIAAKLATVGSADDLLGDPALLRATLASFGLEKDIGNTYFLRQVLQSDAADPASFASRLSDPRYSDLAKAFDLASRTDRPDSIYGFAAAFADRAASIRTVDDLLGDGPLLTSALRLFGLEQDVDRTAFLTSVLTSDLDDPVSAANTLDDPRYAALARVFGFAERAEAAAADQPYESRLEKFVATVSARTDRVATPQAFFRDIGLMLATFDLFNLPSRPDGVAFANRILTSDASSPTSLVNVFPDPRYRAFSDALGLQERPVERTYPDGFAEGIVQNFLDRQFEIRIGESNPTMRFTLALERDLNAVIAAGSSNNSRWFAVLASEPLREVFQTAFQLPAAFATLDIDKQLTEIKARSETFFGTNEVSAFAETERLAALRQQYLVRSETTTSTLPSYGSMILTLLGVP